MEFFLPGLFLFLVSIGITFVVVPKATPMMVSILSLIFLTYGVYHHRTLFASEYRLSTWQEGLKIYAPAVIILSVILFILYGILAFFTSGKVPVPALPNVSIPNTNSLTESLTNTMESIGNSISNTTNSVMNLGNSMVNSMTGNKGNNQSGNVNNKAKAKAENLSRSFLETV